MSTEPNISTWVTCYILSGTCFICCIILSYLNLYAPLQCKCSLILIKQRNNTGGWYLLFFGSTYIIIGLLNHIYSLTLTLKILLIIFGSITNIFYLLAIGPITKFIWHAYIIIAIILLSINILLSFLLDSINILSIISLFYIINQLYFIIYIIIDNSKHGWICWIQQTISDANNIENENIFVRKSVTETFSDTQSDETIYDTVKYQFRFHNYLYLISIIINILSIIIFGIIYGLRCDNINKNQLIISQLNDNKKCIFNNDITHFCILNICQTISIIVYVSGIIMQFINAQKFIRAKTNFESFEVTKIKQVKSKKPKQKKYKHHKITNTDSMKSTEDVETPKATLETQKSMISFQYS